jgi:FkbM family methyltransferase
VTRADTPASGLPVASWRVALMKALARSPAPIRQRVFRVRRAVSRADRRRREARGDFSRSYPALHDMDRQLERYLPQHGGFFVEAGGNDGYTQSNTYALERRRGWRGLLIEPVPELARACVRERPGAVVVRAALVSRDFHEPEVRLRFGGLMTLVVGARDGDAEWVAAAHAVGQEEPAHEFSAPARTLSSILDDVDAPEVDLLSLDIEGYEAQALAGLDFDRHAPRFILVEMRDEESDRAGIATVLGDRYVDVAALSPFDVLYAREDVAQAAGLTARDR